ncbi:hypothetical protein MAE02_41470 [Microvirga aerophila]|uniref:Uncharacterized protein n=1 Tax=Microvirga aerophila TaxID=670291 RepID=A0A512BWX1_9HYPH|nr:hypothetical protein MAE02_41470 [Microvirga aerophila]
MVRRAARDLRHHTGKAQSPEVELVHKGFDDAHGIVGHHIVVQALGKQGDLPAVFPFNETLHAALRRSRAAYQINAFPHSLDPEKTFNSLHKVERLSA